MGLTGEPGSAVVTGQVTGAYRRTRFRRRTKLQEAPNGWFGVARLATA